MMTKILLKNYYLRIKKYERRTFKYWGSKGLPTQNTIFINHKNITFEYLKLLNICMKKDAINKVKT